MKTRLLLLIPVIITILMVQVFSGCAQNQPQQTSTLLKFKKTVYTDREGTGLEAFSFLMPSDWQFDGGIWWILDHSLPCRQTAQLKSLILPATRNLKYYPTVVFSGLPIYKHWVCFRPEANILGAR
jgi:hypothetical protein